MRAILHFLNDFYKTNKNIYNIFVIYINEAHAADIWNIGESAGAINYSHKNITDRISYAKKFQQEFNLDIPIYCDNMDNDFERLFACWPVRYFIIKDKKFVKISEPTDSNIDISDLFNFE